MRVMLVLLLALLVAPRAAAAAAAAAAPAAAPAAVPAATDAPQPPPAAAAAASSEQPAEAASCTLQLLGAISEEDLGRADFTLDAAAKQAVVAAAAAGSAAGGVTHATLTCERGRVHAAAGPDLAGYQLPGLRPSSDCPLDLPAGDATARCLLSICGGAPLRLAATIVGVSASPRTALLCVSGRAAVTLTSASRLQRNNASAVLLVAGAARVRVAQATVESNVARLGTLSAWNESRLELDAAQLTGNVGYDLGGAIVVGGRASLAIANGSWLDTNSVVAFTSAASFYTGQAYGGAIWASGSSSNSDPAPAITIEDSTFIENFVNSALGGSGAKYATTGGGAIFSGRALKLRNVTFEGNVAGKGGAIWLDFWAPLTDVGSRFTANQAAGDASSGGAIYAPGHASITLSSTHFERNQAIGEVCRGGALLVRHYANVTLRSVEFHNNSALGSLSQGGAVFMADEASVTAFNTCWTANAAGFGGAAALSMARLDARGSAFTNNTAVFSGGALSLAHGESPQLTPAPAYEQRLMLNRTQVYLSACNLTGNSARQDGGAIEADWGSTASDTPAASLLVYLADGCRLTGNSAGSSGGAVAIRGGRLKLQGSAAGAATLVAGCRAGADGGGLVVLRRPGSGGGDGGALAPLSDRSAPGCSARSGEQVAGLELVGAVRIAGNDASHVGGGVFVDEGVACDTQSVLTATAGARPPWGANTAGRYGAERKLPWMCDAGFQIVDALVCAECSAGTVALATAPHTCAACPAGASCLGGTRMHALDGFWLPPGHNASHRPVPCPMREACARGSRCNEALGFTGALCGQCLPGYSQPSAFTCHQCDTRHSTLQAAAFGLLPLLGVWGMWKAAWLSTEPHCANALLTVGDAAKVLVFFFQVATLAGRLAWYSWGPSARGLLQAMQVFFSVGDLSVLASAQCALGRWSAPAAADPGHLAWGFARAIAATLLPLAYGLAALLLHLGLVAAALGATSLVRWLNCCACWPAGPPGCAGGNQLQPTTAAGDEQQQQQQPQRGASSRWQVLQQKSLRLAGSASSGLQRVLSGAGLQRRAAHSTWREWWRELLCERCPLLCVVTLIWFFPVLLRAAFSLFVCIDVPGQPEPRLVADLNVVCWRGQHLVLAASLGSVLLLLWCVGVPLLFGVVLCRAGRCAAGPRLHAYLYRPLRPGAASTEGWLQLRMALLVLVSTLSPVVSMGVASTLLVLVLAGFLVANAAFKPCRDFALHWLSSAAHIFLLGCVTAGVLVSGGGTDAGGGGARDAWGTAAALLLSPVVSGAYVVWTCLFIALCLLVVWSQLWRGPAELEQQLCRQAVHGPRDWWVLALSRRARLALPLAHPGEWHLLPSLVGGGSSTAPAQRPAPPCGALRAWLHHHFVAWWRAWPAAADAFTKPASPSAVAQPRRPAEAPAASGPPAEREWAATATG